MDAQTGNPDLPHSQNELAPVAIVDALLEGAHAGIAGRLDALEAELERATEDDAEAGDG